MSDVAWYCNRCKTKQGGRFENFGFRKECLMCKRGKKVAHGGEVPPKDPATRKGAKPKASAKAGAKPGAKPKTAPPASTASDAVGGRLKAIEDQNRQLLARLAALEGGGDETASEAFEDADSEGDELMEDEDIPGDSLFRRAATRTERTPPQARGGGCAPLGPRGPGAVRAT